MPTRLARWVCVLTALAAGSTFAADKPKEKTLSSTSMHEMIRAEAKAELLAEQSTQFVITKPVGTWARDMNLGEAAARFTLEITDTRLTLQIDCVSGAKTVNGRVSIDYSINKESTLFGVIDSCEVKSSEKVELDKLGQFTKFSGQPFAVRFRVEDDGLTFKDFKGLGVGLGDKEPELITAVLTMLNGRFTKVDPSKPLKPLKSSKTETYNSDPLIRQDQLLNQSERPSPTSQRIHGGILKADPPAEEFVELTLYKPVLPFVPVGWSANMCDIPPAPDVPPLPVKLPPLVGTEPLKVDPPPATALAYAGPIGGAVPTPSRSDATVVQAKSEVRATEPPLLIPQLRDDDCPKCGDPPSDDEVLHRFEVMQRFNAKVLKVLNNPGPDSGMGHDGITIVKNLVSDKTDAPRFYPLIGIGRSQCCHWECKVYYYDPKAGKEKVEVISFETSIVRMMVPAGDTGVPQRMTEK